MTTPTPKELAEALECVEGNGGCRVTGAHSNSDCDRMGKILATHIRATEKRSAAVEKVVAAAERFNKLLIYTEAKSLGTLWAKEVTLFQDALSALDREGKS